eukprot:NODE_170_length_16226_cov_0.451169.p11 type:complete len:164 gc:universal NODE_170_length_16226_cov_0.451169:13383-13874(+)
MDLASTRLTQERKKWRKDRKEMLGFSAKPTKTNDKLDLFRWEFLIPGKSSTEWEGGLYRIIAAFPPEYPQKAPKLTTVPPLFHPNVYPSGNICLSLIDDRKDWKSSISMRQLLLSLQSFLSSPNPDDPANPDAIKLFRRDMALYKQRIREQAKERKAPGPEAA